MTEDQQDKMLDVAKHLVTLAIASLGFVVTMMFASSGDEPLLRVTEYRSSLQSGLTLFLCSVIFGFLTEASLIGVSLGQPQRFLFARPVFLLVTAWVFFVGGAVALVVFAMANAFGLPALGG